MQNLPTVSQGFIAIGTGLLMALVGAPAYASSYQILGMVGCDPAVGGVAGGIIYGSTPNCGHGFGTLFSLSTAGPYKLLYMFNGTQDGATPLGRMAMDSSGALFGVTGGGGRLGHGTLFKFADGTLTSLHDFGGAQDAGAPLQGPSLTPAGVLLGASPGGAANQDGGLWRWSQDAGYQLFYAFTGGPDGQFPSGSVTVDKTGTLYGTTAGNGQGATAAGTVWKLPTAGELQTLHVFANGTDGEQPDQAPTLGPDGALYGTTHRQNGGDFEGAIWKLTPAGAFSTLHDFAGPTDGALPNGPLLLGKDGNLYGTTESGGPGGVGTVYRITPAGVFTLVHAFAGDTDGATPTGNLAADSDGALYGGLQSGQIFKIIP